MNRWYRKISPGQFAEVPVSETQEGPSIDEQIRVWVEETGSIIIHPGQLGMHTSWHGDQQDPYQIKCLTFGLTVLYQEATGNVGRQQQQPIQYADPFGFDSGASALLPGSEAPTAGGGD